MDDDRWMREALAEAARGIGLTSPNPAVGAVVVQNSVPVGRGFHPGPGLPHAEIYALRDAGDAARGATLYVTLEPCSTFGRTPPCTEAIQAAGIARVVIATTDPNPRHAGRGVDILREAGVAVDCGVEETAARELNKAFFRWIVTGKPYVLLKMAMTLDGKIATAAGESKWITCSDTRERVQALRRWADAILVSGETLRRDRPHLNVRSPENWPRQPRRLVASRSMDAAEAARYFTDAPAPEVCAVDDWQAWLAQSGKSGLTALLVEGGGVLSGEMLAHGAVDEVEFHIAPKILGGAHSRTAVAGPDPASLAAALLLESPVVERSGDDLIYRARVRK